MQLRPFLLGALIVALGVLLFGCGKPAPTVATSPSTSQPSTPTPTVTVPTPQPAAISTEPAAPTPVETTPAAPAAEAPTEPSAPVAVVEAPTAPAESAPTAPAEVEVPAEPAAPVAVVEAPTAPAETSAPTAPAEVEVPAEPTPAAALTEVAVSASETAAVATVNGLPIGREALDAATSRMIAQYQQFYAQFGMNFLDILSSPDGFSQRLSLQSQALESLVFKAIADAEIERRGIVVSAEELDAEFSKQYDGFLASQGLTEESLSAVLIANGQTLEAFKESGRTNIYEQMLLLKLERDVASPIEVSEEALTAYWEEHRSDYATEEQVRASHILVGTPEEAEAVLADLAAGADFAQVAAERSLDTGSAPQGGDLGFFSRGAMVAEFEDAAFALGVGETSGAVETQYGFHIIRLTERKPGTAPELAEVRAQVLKAAEDEVALERFRSWYEAEEAKSEVVVLDPLIAASRQMDTDPDLALSAFEELLEAGGDVDPHVPYVIGTLYETKLQEAINARERLRKTLTEEDDGAAKLAEAEAAVEALRAKALDAYAKAEITLGGHSAVATRIQAVQSASEAVEEVVPF